MGVDNGYTQRDVIEVSRALTGIGLTYSEESDERPNGVRFVPARFDGGAKMILGRTGQFGLGETMSIITARPRRMGSSRHDSGIATPARRLPPTSANISRTSRERLRSTTLDPRSHSGDADAPGVLLLRRPQRARRQRR
jgi:hypothetical protein